MDKGQWSWKRRIQSWMWPESTRENYFFENEMPPFVYVFCYLASIAICTSGIKLEGQAVFLTISGIYFPLFWVTSSIISRWGAEGTPGEYVRIFAWFNIFAWNIVDRYGERLTEAEYFVLHENSFLFLSPYFAKGGEFPELPTKRIKKATEPLFCLIGRSPDFAYQFFMKLKRKFYRELVFIVLPLMSISIFLILRADQFIGYFMMSIALVVGMMFLLKAHYQFNWSFIPETLQGSYEERAKRALKLYRKSCKNDEERRRYGEQDFLDACYSLEQKLGEINLSSAELWGYVEHDEDLLRKLWNSPGERMRRGVRL
jgi:hypothetical protein